LSDIDGRDTILTSRVEGKENNRFNDSAFRRIGIPALIVAAAVYGVFFIFWFVLAILLALSYKPLDAPFAYLTTLCYPVLAIGSLGTSFVLYRKNRFRAAFFIVFLPLVNICMLLVSFVPIWP
jgi:hypothetical protein